MAVPPPQQPILGLKFWAELARDAFAAVAGAGVGAWLGARFAFGLERLKASEDRRLAAEASALVLAERRATAGNLAILALAQIYNDLIAFRRQFMDGAKATNSAWFWLIGTSIEGAGVAQIDVPSLAFLLQSRVSGAPMMPMKLAIEQDRYKAFVSLLKIRSDFYDEHVPPAIDRMGRPDRSPRDFSDAELQASVGPRTYITLRNYFSDIDTLLTLGLQSSKTTADELRTILSAELPGQKIIGFTSAEDVAQVASPLIQARNRTAAAP